MKDNNFDFPYQFSISENYNTSLNVSAIGKSIREEKSSTYFVPNKFYTFHYVLRGEAEITQGNSTFKISSNDIVVIFPESLCELTVTQEPYINFWLNFRGIDILNLLSYTNINATNPVFSPKQNLSELFEKLYDMQGPEPYHQAQILSIIYDIFSIIMKESVINKKIDYKKYYIAKFIDYIEKNYSNNIQISDIAKYIGISSCQLYRVVTSEFGISPVKFLTEYRINASKIFLKKEKELKIGNISKLCGFSDPLYFSRLFYKYMGISPSEYRNS